MATWAMRKRYEWIADRLANGAPFNRDDLVGAFTITIQTASATIRQFQELHPGQLRYDGSLRAFVRDDRPRANGRSRVESDLLDALSDAYRYISQPVRMTQDTAEYSTRNYNALTAKIRAAIARAEGR